MDFDGTNTKVEHATASILAGNVMTILAWIYLDGAGEGTTPRIFVLPEGAATMSFVWENTNNRLRFFFNFTGGASVDGIWHSGDNSIVTGRWYCVGVSYDKSSTSNDPTFYIYDATTDDDLREVTATETSTPSGTPDTPATGYCVGNVSGQTGTLDGAIAYLQFWSAILTRAELNAAMYRPGSVRASGDLDLFLPLHGASGVDWSGGGQSGTVTAGAARDMPPLAMSLFTGWGGVPYVVAAAPPAAQFMTTSRGYL